MFVYWKGRVRPGRVMRQAVSTLDLTATIAQVSSPQPQPPTANLHPQPPTSTPNPQSALHFWNVMFCETNITMLQ